MVSIIMPARNAERTIRAAVDSVLAQSFKDWELIVIDDASTDGTVERIPQDPRISLLTNEDQLGIAGSRNRGISRAKGIWLAFLDSDDLWHEDKLERQLNFSEGSKALISYTATAYMNAAGERYDFVLRAVHKLTYRELLERNIMSCSSVMVRRKVMIPFPEGNLHEDYVVWLEIVRRTGCAYGLNEALLTYRMAEGTKSSGRLSSALMTYNAYRAAGYGTTAAGFLTLRYATHSISKRRRVKTQRS